MPIKDPEARRIYQRTNVAKWRKANPEKALAQSRKSHAKRRERSRAYVKEWRKKNPEKVKAQKALFYRRHKAKLSKWYIEYYHRTYQKIAERHRRYSALHPEKITAWANLRRARKLGAATGDRVAYAAFVKLSRSDALIPCYWCGKRTRKGKRHLDHIMPLSRGGADDVFNLCVSCPRCNLSKHARDAAEFSGQHLIDFSKGEQ